MQMLKVDSTYTLNTWMQLVILLETRSNTSSKIQISAISHILYIGKERKVSLPLINVSVASSCLSCLACFCWLIPEDCRESSKATLGSITNALTPANHTQKRKPLNKLVSYRIDLLKVINQNAWTRLCLLWRVGQRMPIPMVPWVVSRLPSAM